MLAGHLPGACTSIVLNIMENMFLLIWCTHSLWPPCTFVCLKGPMFIQTSLNGSKCCVMCLVLLPVRVHARYIRAASRPFPSAWSYTNTISSCSWNEYWTVCFYVAELTLSATHTTHTRSYERLLSVPSTVETAFPDTR